MRNTLSYRERTQVEKILRRSTKRGQSTLTDQEIAKSASSLLNRDVTLNNVARLRREMEIKPLIKHVDKKEDTARVAVKKPTLVRDLEKAAQKPTEHRRRAHDIVMWQESDGEWAIYDSVRDEVTRYENQQAAFLEFERIKKANPAASEV